MKHEFKTTAEAVAAFESQGVLQPGETGWWKVWGANPHTIRTGDLVMFKHDNEYETNLITGTFVSNAHPLRVGLVSDACEFEDGKFTLGAFGPVVVVRWGDRNTLAENLR
jgi:hypothetical protein